MATPSNAQSTATRILRAAKLDSHGIKLRVKEAANEVARPVFFAAMIILVVFMPLFSFQGVEAKLFEPMAISIMLAIISAVLWPLWLSRISQLLFQSGY